MSVTQTLRDRFNELSEQRDLDTSDVTTTVSSRDYLRLNAPGVEPVEAWGNSGVRNFLNRLEGEQSDPDAASRDAAEGRAADRREDIQFIQNLPATGASGGDPDPDTYHALANVEEGSDRLFISNVNDQRKTLSVYESESRNNRIGSLTIDPQETPNAATRLLNAVRDLGPDAAKDVAAGAPIDEDLAESASNRETRRELRNELDTTFSEAGYDPDNWNTDIRSDGTLIIQDPDSNKTETIELGEDADSFNPDTFDTSSPDTESPSPAPESNDTGATPPDMSGLNRPKVVATIFGIIALIYGVTQ